MLFKLIFIVSIFSVFNICVSAEPLLSTPSFTSLSTENGLSQDTVNDMLIDKDGMLWIATEAGLNRFDGNQNVQYLGKNNEFADDGIYTLFEDQGGNLWVSTYSGGVYRVDRDTGKSERLVYETYKDQPSWYQYASHFLSAPDKKIYIALDHLVIKFDLVTKKKETVFDLLSSDLGLSSDDVIRHMYLFNDILFIATSAGLYANLLPSGEIKRIEHTRENESNIDNRNAKLIVVDKAQKFWLGTVEGLYQFELNELVQFVKKGGVNPDARRIVESLNIWDLKQNEGSLYYMSTDQGLFTFDVTTHELNHLFRPSDSRLQITDDDLYEVALTADGQVWLSTGTSGALLWSPEAALFKNVMGDGKSHDKLSDNIVYGFYEADDQNLWIGTNNGLNLYNLKTNKVEHFLVSQDEKAVASLGTIYTIRPAEHNMVWLLTAEGIRKFDISSKRIVPYEFGSKLEQLFNSAKAYDLIRTSQNKYLIAADGKFWLLDEKKELLSNAEALSSNIDYDQLYTFLPDYEARDGTILLAMMGELWRFNTETGVVEKLHQARKSQSEYAIHPTDTVLDNNGVLWIAYPGHGLYGIDAATYRQKYFFDTSNLLPTNLIVSLDKDPEGNIWIGSHQGLLKFDPKKNKLWQFSTREGLASNEFTWGSKLGLKDGKLVFGSQKGFTIFSPDKFSKLDDFNAPTFITDIDLLSHTLELGIGTKNGSFLQLEHDDVGLTIHYSDLKFGRTSTAYYQYELNGDVEIVYPPTKSTKVTFPQLEPGDYEFSVARIDPVSKMSGSSANLKINVKYPVYASPIAYLIYLLFLVSIASIILRRRKSNNEKLRAAHSEALRHKNRLSMALTASNSRVWEWYEDSNNISQNRIVEDLGYTDLGTLLSFDEHVSLIHKHDVASFLEQWNRAINGLVKGIDISYRLKAKDGDYKWYRDVGSMIAVNDGKYTQRLVGTYSNITESVNAEFKARLFGEAFQHTRDWVIVFDSNFQAIVANQSIKDALGVAKNTNLIDDLTRLYLEQSRQLRKVLHAMRKLGPNEHWSGETFVDSFNERRYVVNIRVTAVTSERNSIHIDRYLVIVSDITEQKDAQNALVQLANYDNLTGLPNRTLLLDRLQHALHLAAQKDSRVGLFFIDLDRFKQVNDSLGHEAGDELLITVARRLERLVNKTDTVARLGGDEFVVLFEGVEQIDELGHVAHTMIQALGQTITLSNQEVSVSASVGISLFPDDAKAPVDLLKNADIAMYHAKEAGSDNFQYFTEHMNERARSKLQLENKIKRACIEKSFLNYYQPIVCCTTGAIKGFEVLMRWEDGEFMVSPDIFIPVAENIGLIAEMTVQLIERVLPVYKEFSIRDSELYLSINLSAKHFTNEEALMEVVELLKVNNVSTSNIRFEITESALMSNYDVAMSVIGELKAMGFMIALDDFGTGYSSLKYLKDFPIDVLKIDKSFVEGIGLDSGNEAIILATLRMAESLGLECVAEGIETIEQVKFFQMNGCSYLQGYYFSKPVAEDNCLALLRC
ncbi:EAL domain-containing protein [Alteromonas gracilis]|uniref:EAL domain-containing protein n=1 Tax=Alteromonas gracilis TaxID=1479524 RepID=UPI003734D28C